MGRYIVRRLILLAFTTLGAALIIFIIMRVIPGDIATLMVIGHEDAEISERSFRRIETMRTELGLNDPMPVQFVAFLKDFATGNWGESVWTGQKISDIIERRFPVTVELALIAMIFTVIISIPIGILSALRQDTILDYVLRVFSITGLSIPNFWLGILALMILAAYFSQWFPPVNYSPIWEDPKANLSMLLIPGFILGFSNAALLARMTRSSMLEVLRQDYIRTAHSKGLRPRSVTIRHALRNALIPVVTLAGLQLGNLLSGSIVTEFVFNLPGLGQTVVQAVRTRDFPVVQNFVLLFTIGYGLMNLGVDLLYAWLNPRIRYN